MIQPAKSLYLKAWVMYFTFTFQNIEYDMHSPSIRIVCYWVTSLQDAARVYGAAHAGKNQVLEQRHSVKLYSI